jgi:hypothetical protein
LSYFQQAENHRFCDAGVGYSSSFPYSTRSSQFLSFLSLNSSYYNSPTFIPLYVSISALPSRRYGTKQVWPCFISDFPLKKRLWLSFHQHIFDLELLEIKDE